MCAGGLLDLPRGRGYQKLKLLIKGKYEPKLEFTEGWLGSNQKTLHGRGIIICWNSTIYNAKGKRFEQSFKKQGWVPVSLH